MDRRERGESATRCPNADSMWPGLCSSPGGRTCRRLRARRPWIGAVSVDGKRPLTSDFRRSAPQINAWTPVAIRYLRRELGYRTDLPYIGVDGGETVEQGFAPSGKYPASMNSRWVHSAIYDPT